MSDEHDPVVTVSVLESELTILRSDVKSELSALRSEMAELERRLEQRISEDGALTRARFDIMLEKVYDSVRLVTAHHATILDNHESRLQKIEKR